MKHTLTVILGSDIDCPVVDQTLEFSGPVPAVGDELLCLVWVSRLSDPDSDVAGEARDFVSLLVKERRFMYMSTAYTKESQIVEVVLFTQRLKAALR